MPKKQLKKQIWSKKPPAKKARSRKKPPATKAVNLVSSSVLAPEVENNKYSLPKTWISEKQVIKLLQKTPRDHVYNRPAKGGGTWDYVTGVYVKKVLNYVFGWLWDFKVVEEKMYGLEEGWGQIVVRGELTVKDEHGKAITKTQYGRSDVKYRTDNKKPLDIGNDYKAAATDALKKCASELGIASDIYGKNEFKEIKKPFEETEAKIESPNDNKVIEGDVKDQIACHTCAVFVTKAEERFSQQRYKVVLCRECQKGVKK